MYFHNSRIIVDCRAGRGIVWPMKIEDAAARLEALGNPTRLKVYHMLVRAGAAGLSVGTLQARLDIAPSTLSFHLNTLFIVALVTHKPDPTPPICPPHSHPMHC